ncbi:MAG: hypothetical protein KDD62_01940, partial [Bdellovibrionales bacterium]|nr:hypothetical protein [Bdellovibrionales bacterium]
MASDKKHKLLDMLMSSEERDGLHGHQSELKLMRSMEYGDEPHRIFKTITQLTLELDKVVGAGLYLPRESSEDDEELIAESGEFQCLDNLKPEGTVVEALSQRLEYYRKDEFYFFEIMCLGAPIGALVVQTKSDLEESDLLTLRHLAHHAAVTHERMRLTRTLQHFLDRVEVLNELNQLIASNVSSQKVIRQV